MKNLRSVKVYFDNGDTINTSMASTLSNEQIREYYKIGKYFNLGNVNDLMAKVIKVDILK